MSAPQPSFHPPYDIHLLRGPTEAKIRYLLGTSAPYNWIPFIPVHITGSN
ncbi:hypothetical protein [Spirosoma foliorum]|uniref:Uncharacterized protein n=1 Tax=Spirosoma foliorum TaxID=2710596 RepID=A0A7G5GRB0_9BACT|nr:hypothetical protein [Spirosoma foliorum]QMW01402.1 hypothetical protein H3H32_26080 [Spirosoma foliorum]